MVSLSGGKRLTLRFDAAIDFYVDESSQNGLKYLVMGSLATRQKSAPNIVEKFARLRNEKNFKSELKWKKVSNQKYPFYEAWIDAFFELARGGFVRFNALVVDTSKFDHHKHNEGDGDLGFNKLLYQLLLHRIGKRYKGDSPLYGYLDRRTTKHTPENLRQILNAGLAKYHKIDSAPFRSLQFIESVDSDLIQTVDVLIGGIAYAYNGHALKLGAKEAKKKLSEQIMRRVTKYPFSRQCDIWDFAFKK